MFSKIYFFRGALLIGFLSSFFYCVHAKEFSVQKSERQYSLGDVQSFLNNIQNLKARFEERSNDGVVRHGTLWLVRKLQNHHYGKFKFVYDLPDTTEIMADGQDIIVFDKQKKDQNAISIDDTPAVFLLRPFINLKDPDLKVSFLQVGKNDYVLTISQKDDPEGMGMRIGFVSNYGFLQIAGWSVRDQQGSQTHVILSEVERNISIDEKNIFKSPF